jgi:hypothetical protein
MRLLEIESKGKILFKKLIAESWNELKGEQIVKYCAWYYQYRYTVFEVVNDKIMIQDAALLDKMRHLLLMTILDISYEKYLKIDAAMLHTLKEESGILNFLFEQNTRTKAPFRRINITDRIIPTWHYAPGEMLKGVSFEEFIMLDKYYLHYTEQNNIDSINALCAILYRPVAKKLNVKSPEWNGDMREAYSPHLIPARLKYWLEKPIGLKLAVYRYYEGCRIKLKSFLPHLFDDADVSQANEPADWAEILHGLAGGKFGTLESTKRAAYMEVLKDMDITIKNKPRKDDE